ncbi:MAG: group 1 glycosyl transferase [Solirubrobacterales bacterium]|nr:group 1 glycosyl transferase [Solirubrobacterales bacterium]
MSPRRFLFCVPTMQLSGGIKVVLELSDRLVRAGHEVDLFSWSGPPAWHVPAARMLATGELGEVDLSRYDFVIVTPGMFLPMVLPRLGTARCVFLAQDYESYHHARGDRYEDFLAESPALAALYRLPVPIVTISRPLVDVIAERAGRTAYHLPLGVNKATFAERPRPRAGGPRRVALVGNYLMPYKGMRDGRDALEMLAREIDVELVLITQEERGRELFAGCSYPVEVHFCPAEPEVPAILGSCHAYCCTSWYEGLGLPAIEAFHCGVPVVSTRTIGVGEYAEDGVNLLLAEPSDPGDLRDKLRRVLTDADLAEALRREGLRTAAGGFDWDESMRCFEAVIADIEATYAGPGAVDAAEMEALLAALERQGSHTPIAVVRRFEALSAQLDEVCAELAAGGSPTAEHAAAIERLRDALAPYVQNPDAQYHSAFRPRYDLCRLLLELMGSAETAAHIPLLLSPKHRPPSRGPALTEHRYPVG